MCVCSFLTNSLFRTVINWERKGNFKHLTFSDSLTYTISAIVYNTLIMLYLKAVLMKL